MIQIIVCTVANNPSKISQAKYFAELKLACAGLEKYFNNFFL